MSHSKNFRYDINALRALAVLAVVFFHLDFPGFQSGFTGVDIFFVISGFLMTGIILEKLEKDQTFSFSNFYLARARRIIPALLALIATLLIIFGFYLSSFDYQKLAKHSFGAIIFVSNFLLGNESGSFDTDSHEKLLLHTWSLSTEWQFYLILPAILVFFTKKIKFQNAHRCILLILFISSLVASITLTKQDPSKSFFLLHTRAWEMLAGSIVFLLSRSYQPKGIVQGTYGTLGYLIIFYSIFFINPNADWPSWQAMIPVTGTCLVIFAHRNTSYLINHPIIQIVGKGSYSIYLWHWPLCVMLYILSLESMLSKTMVLIISILIGLASWKMIEEPAQSLLKRLPNRKQWLAIFIPILVIIIACLIIYKNKGIPNRIPAYVESIAQEKNNIHPKQGECLPYGNENFVACTYGGSTLAAVLIGDSHAGSLVGSLEKSLPSHDHQLLSWTFSGCPTIYGIQHTKHNEWGCTQLHEKIKEQLQSIPKNTPIFIINRYSQYINGMNEMRQITPDLFFKNPFETFSVNYKKALLDGYKETICSIAKERKVFMMRPIPEMIKNVPSSMYKFISFLNKEKHISIPRTYYDTRNKDIINLQDQISQECNVSLIDTASYFCNDQQCLGDLDGMPIYYDDDHLSERGGEILIPAFKQALSSSVHIN